MEHKGTQRLETQRLLLRPFTLADAEAMHSNWASDSAVTRFLTWPPHPSIEESRRIIRMWIESCEKPDGYQWAIELKSLGEAIGSINVVRMNEAFDECELGWCIGSRWWGKGIMPEAGAAVLRYLFDEVKANRVAARHAVHNPNSGRVMQKLGMVKEGVLRSADRSIYGTDDQAVYSMLSSDYLSEKREQLIECYGLILN